jgi:hypothetical protein
VSDPNAHILDRVVVSKTLVQRHTNVVYEAVPASVVPHVFGELAKLAVPLLTHYHSDLYWDAHWLDQYVKGAEVTESGTLWWWYSVRSTGTSIGTGRDEVEHGAEKLYNVTLQKQGYKWNLLVLDVTEPV